MNKRYFWIKLPTIYFNNLSQKKMRKQQNGLLFQVIYLKLMLLSCNTNGVIYYQNVYDSIAEEIAEEINESAEDVKTALEYFEKNKLLEYQEHDAVIPQAVDLIGSETQSTIRSRNCRDRQKALQRNTLATHLQQNATKCNIEGEGEKEVEKEVEKEGEGEKNTPTPPTPNYKYIDLSAEDKNRLIAKYGESITTAYIEKAERTGENRNRVIDNSYLFIVRMIEQDYTPQDISAEIERQNNRHNLKALENYYLSGADIT